MVDCSDIDGCGGGITGGPAGVTRGSIDGFGACFTDGSITGLMTMGGTVGGAPFGPAASLANNSDLVTHCTDEFMMPPCANTVFQYRRQTLLCKVQCDHAEAAMNC
jgi:hypothetical protein